MKTFLMLVGLVTILGLIAVATQNVTARQLVLEDAILAVSMVDEDGDILGLGFDPATLFGGEEVGYLTLHMRAEVNNSGPLAHTVTGVEFGVSLMADSSEVVTENGSEPLEASIDAGSSEDIAFSFRLDLEDALEAGTELFEADDLEVVLTGNLQVATWFTGSASIPFELTAEVELPGANLLDQIDLNLQLPSF